MVRKSIFVFNSIYILLLTILYGFIQVSPYIKQLGGFISQNGNFIYISLAVIAGLMYPILYRLLLNLNVVFFKGLIQINLTVGLVQLVIFLVYILMSSQLKYHGWSGLIVFIIYFVMSLVLVSLSYFLGYFINKIFFK